MSQPEQVSAESAWRAAVDRAKRGTEALIVAEARILELEMEVGRLEQSGREAAGRELTLRARVTELEGGGDDGQTGDYNSATAVSEAVPAYPFSD